MPPGQALPDVRTFLRQAYDRIPRRRFWIAITASFSLGILIALPLAALLIFHEGPWTGFLWDFLFRLPFVAMCLGFVGLLVRGARQRRWKEVLQGIVVLALFGTITFVACRQFVLQLGGLLRFRRLQVNQVRSVAVECHSSDDPGMLREIVGDLRAAEWYSPDSHGWAPYVALTLRFADGHIEIYTLTEILAEGRLVVHPAPGNSGLLAIPHLSDSLQRAGLLSVSSHLRYDKKGLYDAIVPSSVCKAR